MHWYDTHPHLQRFHEENIAQEGSIWIPGRSAPPLPDIGIYAQVLARDAVRDFADESYAKFHNEFAKRISDIYDLDQHYASTPEPIYTAAVYRELPRERSFEEKIADVELHLKHWKSWTEKPEERVMNYHFKHDSFEHPESAFALILQAGPHTIATAGFRLIRDADGKTVLSINNVQGVGGKAKSLRRFTNRMKESWRDHLVKRLIEHANEQDFKVRAEVPTREALLIPTPEQYEVITHDYEKLYRRLGFRRRGRYWVKD